MSLLYLKLLLTLFFLFKSNCILSFKDFLALIRYNWYLQGSWTNAMRKQREKLLELIRRLAEDDKEGVMAHKVIDSN